LLLQDLAKGLREVVCWVAPGDLDLVNICEGVIHSALTAGTEKRVIRRGKGRRGENLYGRLGSSGCRGDRGGVTLTLVVTLFLPLSRCWSLLVLTSCRCCCGCCSVEKETRVLEGKK
jgi:hypothetical protein